MDIMLKGKTNRVVGYKEGTFVDFDIEDALGMNKSIDNYQFEVAHLMTV